MVVRNQREIKELGFNISFKGQPLGPISERFYHLSIAPQVDDQALNMWAFGGSTSQVPCKFLPEMW
jgi:hypothetical protein